MLAAALVRDMRSELPPVFTATPPAVRRGRQTGIAHRCESRAVSPFTPMGSVRAYGTFARGMKRAWLQGQFRGRKAVPLITMIALPFVVIAVAVLLNSR